jgi:hypothetical protein
MSFSAVVRGARLSRVAVGVVLALALVMIGVPQPGIAASRAHVSSAPVAARFRLKPVAGSARYLIYTKLGVQANGRLTGRGGLFVLTSNGATRRLTTITTDDGSYSLAGHSLVYTEGQTLIVHWWNIVTGAHRQMVYYKNHPANDVEVGAYGAAPHGVLVGEDDPTHPHDQLLEVDRFDGKLRPLDAPFPKRHFYGLYDTGGQVVVFDLNNSSDDGAVKVVSFTKPGQAQRLASSGLGAHLCRSATHYYVACQVSPNSNAKNLASSMHLLGTDGRRHASTTKGCGSPYAGVLGESVAWIVIAHQSCPAYHLWTLNINGKVSESTRTFTVAAPIAAFHQVVVDNRAKTSLEELSSANAKPHILVHVK